MRLPADLQVHYAPVRSEGRTTVGVLGESFQGAPEPVVVELFDRQVVGVGQGSGLSPRSDAEEGLGLEQAVGDQDLDQGPPGDVALPGDDPVAGGGEVQLVEVVGDGGQSANELGLELGRESASFLHADASPCGPSGSLCTCPIRGAHYTPLPPTPTHRITSDILSPTNNYTCHKCPQTKKLREGYITLCGRALGACRVGDLRGLAWERVRYWNACVTRALCVRSMRQHAEDPRARTGQAPDCGQG
jgi:hypothetical protein